MRLTIDGCAHVDVETDDDNDIMISVTAGDVKQLVYLDYAEAETLAHMILATVKHGAR